MKPLFFLLVLFVLVNTVEAQTTSGMLKVRKPFILEVGHLTTTIITYPFPVKDADRGISNLLATKVPGVENAIKVKALQPFYDTTTLHVFTQDGRVHAFKVIYNCLPKDIIYEWNDDQVCDDGCSLIKYEGAPYNLQQLTAISHETREKRPFLYRRTRKDKMQLWLQGLYYDSSIIVAAYKINNISGLSYTAGISEVYISDKKQSKRTSSQQIPITPVYNDPLPTINGFDHKQWVLIIPKMTIPRKKKLQLTISEKYGARKLKLQIKNRDLLKAKPL